MTLPPCPDPAGCTVDLARFEELAANPGGLRTTVHPSTRFSFRVYSIKDGMHAPNPGVGNTRFAPFEDDGFVEFGVDRVQVTPRGRFFIRNLCMELDAYLPTQQGQGRFSRTV